MLARVGSGALVGVDAVLVEVEVDMSLGLPFFNVVGLPDGTVKESKVRVLSALKNAGFELPQKRITVNLAPADIKKESAAFELPIALGVLCAARLLDGDGLSRYLFGGELSLDGSLKPIRGALPLAVAARNLGYRGVMVPAANAAEAALVDRIDVIAISHLKEAVAHLSGETPRAPFQQTGASSGDATGPPDMSDVRSHADVKVWLEVAAAGGHNLLLCGPPGSGKTMLARRLPGILPALDPEEALEVTKVYSVLGLLPEGQSLISSRPFRTPHHTISEAGLVGGGPLLRPGELSMAHHGVLFLDELPEFRRNVLELLRQPLEEGAIHLARAVHHVTYPSRVMLVAAMNPCPCGYFNVAAERCQCKKPVVHDYFNRVSGPLLDRIDISLQTRPLSYQQMATPGAGGPSSSYFRQRVELARERQRRRYTEEPGVHCNAQMTPELMRRHCQLSERSHHLLESAIQLHGLSARAYDRILRLARTAADLDSREQISDTDIQFAIDGRQLDRRSWLHGSARPQRPKGYFDALAGAEDGARVDAADPAVR